MAARRFYMPSTGSPSGGVTPAPGSAWNQTSGLVRRALVDSPSNSALGPRSVADAGTVNNWHVLIDQYVSDALLPAKTIDGDFSFVIITQESSAQLNAFLRVVARVVSEDGATERGVLLDHTGAVEFATGSQTRIVSAQAMTPQVASSGDRLVVEVGYRSGDSTSTGRTGFIRPGDPTATADFALTSGLTTDLRPWLEFSNDPFASEAVVYSGWGIPI